MGLFDLEKKRKANWEENSFAHNDAAQEEKKLSE